MNHTLKRRQQQFKRRLTTILATWPILAAIAITATSALASRPIEPTPVCWLKPFIARDPGLDAGAAGE